METGSLKPRQRQSDYPRLITPEGCLYLEYLLSKKVDLTLEVLRERYEKSYGIQVRIGTMFNTLKRLNITLKKTFSGQKNIRTKR
jgi:transposase